MKSSYRCFESSDSQVIIVYIVIETVFSFLFFDPKYNVVIAFRREPFSSHEHDEIVVDLT